MPFNPALHTLLLLSDSALPLGSFAYSSGLESFLAHHNMSGPKSHEATRLAAFDTFLEQSLQNIASTALPYLLTAYHNPLRLSELDNDMDASTPCTVARRASVNQGRALLGVWERALSSASDPSSPASQQLTSFAARMKTKTPDAFGLELQAHFAPLFGAVCAALTLSEHESAYLFLLNHAKAVLSAAVRASVMGPYQNHAMLASAKLQKRIAKCVELQAGVRHEDAVVTIPTMDLWMGRHELLYSRIFNS